MAKEHETTAVPHVAGHFQDLAQQSDALRLGMWIFLGTEILLFGGLFVAYALYRMVYGEAFAQSSASIDLTLGTVNTVVLISSSLSVAAGLHWVQHDRRRLASLALALTIALGLAFLGLKAIEYSHHFADGALPGRYYHFAEVQAPGANLFFTLYFLLTGLHAIHVTIGLGVLAWLTRRTWLGDYSSSYWLPLELGALYWHLVDVIWIFIYPLLYLVT